MSKELLSKWYAAKEKLREAQEAIDDLQREIEKLRQEHARQIESMQIPFGISGIDQDLLKQFLKQPYLLIPRRSNSYYLVIPRWIPLQLGWLEWQTPSYNVFVINRYTQMMIPLPKEIAARLGPQPDTRLQVSDGILKAPHDMKEYAWQRYRRYLYKRDQLGLRIKKGYEIKLLAELIRDGYLPFTPQPVDTEDLKEGWPDRFRLLPHQREAYEAWLKWGAIGIYWPAGQGKTFFGAALCWKVKGPKLIVVPNISEKEQWQIYLHMFNVNDVQLLTYRSYHKVGKEYALTIFDEAHRLPANTWSRFATINTKYRIGLSATPYREDGREDLIIALTGYPVGMSWEHFLRTRAIRKPRITVKVVPTEREKMSVLEDLLKIPVKTLIFVELIQSGEKISKKFGIPFVYGNTKNRLSIIKKNLVTVVSRVGDEGISIKDLERTIEVEFLGRSRRQEAQRAYRLLHSVKPEINHIVIMTARELDQYGRRFLALEEKGFHVEYEYTA
jgi:DNA excision repair protein ERCC-3